MFIQPNNVKRAKCFATPPKCHRARGACCTGGHAQPRLAAKPSMGCGAWRAHPGEALASGVAKGQMGCALPPCQKGALALAQLARPTASCKALAACLVANCKAKQKMGCA